MSNLESTSNYIKIYTGNFAMVQRMASALEKINIIPVITNPTASGLSSTFGASSRVTQQIAVHYHELDKAVLVVERIISEFK